MNTDLIARLKEFMDDEAMSCSMKNLWLKVHG